MSSLFLTDEELQQEIEDRMYKLELHEGYLDDPPSGSLAGVYHMLTMDHHAMGVYRLLEGDVEAAREAFATAAGYQREYLLDVRAHRGEVDIYEEVSEPAKIEQGMWFAILSSDEAVRETIAAEAWNIPDEHVQRFGRAAWVARTKALAAILTDDPRAQTFLDDLDEAVEEPFDRLTHDAYRGIHDEDTAAVQQAVERMLKRHDDQIDGVPTRKGELMSLGPTAMVVLSRERGLDVAVDSPYLPEVLLEAN